MPGIGKSVVEVPIRPSRPGTDVAAPSSKKLPHNLFSVLTNKGASFSIANILYLVSVETKTSESCSFLRIKNVSKSTLFLSDDGNVNHILPSSALYHLSIARL